MYLSRKHLIYIVLALSAVVILLALTGCQTPNPSWGGSRW